MITKRMVDLLLAALMLSLFLPLLVILSITIIIAMGFPVFFRQVRPGKSSALFTLYKFRTMSEDFDSQGRPLPDSKRLTCLGRFLRKTSLDELPQLWNVLKGDMSLVGPRPLLPEYLPLYNKRQARRHEVQPGITGWAQVNGRNAISWEEKFELDVWYVDNKSLWLDLKILLLTIIKVLSRKDINAGKQEPMKPFTGSH